MAILAAACARERTVTPGITRILPEQWWSTAACGDVPPLQVGGVQAPVVVSHVEPVWPESVRVRGVIIATAVIDANGDVCDARVIRTFEGVPDEPVLNAVRQWKFKPAMYQGKPRAAVYSVSFPVERRRPAG